MESFHHFDSAEAQLPPGYRFHPTDEELITYYLMKKVLDGTFIARAIAEVDLNKCEPWELPEKAKMGEKEWYFFSLRDRKYPTGLRTNRATEAGYWKATGKDREIFSSRSGALVGMKKTLVFYKGRAPKGEKTNWVMHEYRLEGKFSYHYLPRTTKDEWVVSRVFQKSGGGGGKKTRVAGSAYADVGSPSTSSLTPLLESSLYTTTTTVTTGGTTTDQESCSYESESAREHVPCFSTVVVTAAASAATFGHPSLVPPSMVNVNARSCGPSGAFPSLRSLQENLQLPFFFSAVAPPQMQVGLEQQQTEMSGSGNWREPDPEQKMVVRGEDGRPQFHPQQQMGTTELDCLWTY